MNLLVSTPPKVSSPLPVSDADVAGWKKIPTSKESKSPSAFALSVTVGTVWVVPTIVPVRALPSEITERGVKYEFIPLVMSTGPMLSSNRKQRENDWHRSELAP